MELTKIRGISESREKDLNCMGIFDTADLIRLFPRKYLDLREKQSLTFCYHNDVVLTCGKVISVPAPRYFKGRSIVRVNCEQEGLFFSVIWFNQPYVVSKLKIGEEYLFYGRVNKEGDGVKLINPSFENVEKAVRLKGIVPQYRIKGSLTQKVVRDAVRLSVDLEKPKSIIPKDLQEKHNLSDLYDAYKKVHNPDDMKDVVKSSERIAVEEYFALISAFKFIKGGKEQKRFNRYDCDEKELLKFIVDRFPFEFTDGQKNAVSEIYADLKGEKVMNRLLQGDVGSGKTAVSNCAIFIAVKSGYQAVMLAPTEVLARQNYAVLKNIFKDYNVGLLVGSMTAKEKREVKESARLGIYNILVGTHALLEEDVEFKALSLCICDEQQRFGVAQRSAILNKGLAPDLLVMSATPIPRTLSLIFYGDLDITTIKEKPKNRRKIQTNIVPKEKYNDMLAFIKREISEGRQAYFVTPLIEGDEEGSVISATELFNEIKERMSPIPVGLLHGKMKDKDKNAVMTDFKDGKIKILVSTTVIEVGMDVPQASVMVIYNAERFGLSTLHQLRGRVGRSDIKSYCFLLSNEKGIENERLKIMEESDDGFKISESDYKMRGSGDFMGSRQSGKFISDLGDLNYDTSAIFLAKEISDEAFALNENMDEIRAVAVKKYEKLKDVSLN